MSFKQIIISGILIVMATVSYSCKDTSKQVESKQAATVVVNQTVNTSKYEKIKNGSVLNWKATHLGGINPRIGKIYVKEASVLVNDSKVTNISVTINMDKIMVDNLPEEDAEELVKHLKSEDFFHIEKYPFSKFDLTDLETIEGEYNSKVTGNLTILGISKSITFKANLTISEEGVSVISENFSINRTDWGLTYNAKGTAGVPLDYLISDEVGFQIVTTITK